MPFFFAAGVLRLELFDTVGTAGLKNTSLGGVNTSGGGSYGGIGVALRLDPRAESTARRAGGTESARAGTSGIQSASGFFACGLCTNTLLGFVGVRFASLPRFRAFFLPLLLPLVSLGLPVLGVAPKEGRVGDSIEGILACRTCFLGFGLGVFSIGWCVSVACGLFVVAVAFAEPETRVEAEPDACWVVLVRLRFEVVPEPSSGDGLASNEGVNGTLTFVLCC